MKKKKKKKKKNCGHILAIPLLIVQYSLGLFVRAKFWDRGLSNDITTESQNNKFYHEKQVLMDREYIEYIA